MKKLISLVIILMIFISANTGCTAAQAYQEIRQQPGVLDIAVYTKNKDIKLEIIMEDEADLSLAEGMAQQYSKDIKERFTDKNVTVNIVQNRCIVYSHSL